MTEFVFEDRAGKKVPLVLGPLLAEGAAGRVYTARNISHVVVKLYKDGEDLPGYARKIRAMVDDPPCLPDFEREGRTYVQIAWPRGPVLDRNGAFRGFLMPEVDVQGSTELENILQRAQRQRKGLPEFYGVRVLLAANLAALMAELHKHDHFMIDMKPANIRFYPGSLSLAILDTDGFSIGGSERFTAQHFSDEYIAPEAEGKRPRELGLQQDLFALATILFRLLNNGLHPFQGVDMADKLPSAIQPRIFARLYAYGLSGSARASPSKASLHDFFELDTRRLFDRAFAKTDNRPSAQEWREHLADLKEKLVRCAAVPDEHGHFFKGCGLCEIESKFPGLRPQRPVQIKPKAATASQLRPAPRAPPFQAPPAKPSVTVKRAAAAAAGAFLIAVFVTYLAGVPNSPGPPLTASKQFSFADIEPALPALNIDPKGYEQHLWNEHRKWAAGRSVLECRYGEGDGFSVRFWHQQEAAPYGAAWLRIIKGHPFAGIQKGAPACPPDHSSALLLPHGLALEIETWQAPAGVWRDGALVRVDTPPALNCLYLRSGGFDWLQFKDRRTQPRCPSSYSGSPISGVRVFGLR